jgi:hypothetical protein
MKITVAAIYAALSATAFAQTGNSVGSGLSGNAGTMHGANIDNVNGTNANGTPMSQSPGASMTVGAGNSTMLPSITGGSAVPSHIVPPKIVQGTTNGTTNGTAKPETSTKPAP